MKPWNAANRILSSRFHVSQFPEWNAIKISSRKNASILVSWSNLLIFKMKMYKHVFHIHMLKMWYWYISQYLRSIIKELVFKIARQFSKTSISLNHIISRLTLARTLGNSGIPCTPKMFLTFVAQSCSLSITIDNDLNHLIFLRSFMCLQEENCKNIKLGPIEHDCSCP